MSLVGCHAALSSPFPMTLLCLHYHEFIAAALWSISHSHVLFTSKIIFTNYSPLFRWTRLYISPCCQRRLATQLCNTAGNILLELMPRDRKTKAFIYPGQLFLKAYPLSTYYNKILSTAMQCLWGIVPWILQWRHDERDDVSNHGCPDGLHKHLFRHQ